MWKKKEKKFLKTVKLSCFTKLSSLIINNNLNYLKSILKKHKKLKIFQKKIKKSKTVRQMKNNQQSNKNKSPKHNPTQKVIILNKIQNHHKISYQKMKNKKIANKTSLSLITCHKIKMNLTFTCNKIIKTASHLQNL